MGPCAFAPAVLATALQGPQMQAVAFFLKQEIFQEKQGGD
jgi:hypothetical protein